MSLDEELVTKDDNGAALATRSWRRADISPEKFSEILENDGAMADVLRSGCIVEYIPDEDEDDKDEPERTTPDEQDDEVTSLDIYDQLTQITLASFTPSDQIKWRRLLCDACCAGETVRRVLVECCFDPHSDAYNPELGTVFLSLYSGIFTRAVLDKSVMNRPEVASYAGITGNKALSYVGDAYMTLYISRLAFTEKCTPQAYHEARTRFTNSAYQTRVYHSVFGATNPIVTYPHGTVLWRQPPTDTQAADFIKALVGTFVVDGRSTTCADWILKHLFGIHCGE